MANEKNLIPFDAMPEEQRKELASRGGKKSGEVKRRKKTLRQYAEIVGKSTVQNIDPEIAAASLTSALGDEELTHSALTILALYAAAESGDVQAAKELRSVLGEDTATAALKLKREELRLKKAAIEKPDENVYRGIPASAIAPTFAAVHHAVLSGHCREYVCKGGRGSTKSSFIALQIVDRIMSDETIHACVVRKVGNTLRDSVYAKLTWAIDKLGLNKEFEFTVSPMEITRKKTGQKIFFRGSDKPEKLKSISPPFGYIGELWFEELDQFAGTEEVRSITQSIIRGGDTAHIYKSFNPPKTSLNWVNKDIEIPSSKRYVHSSDYRDVPAEWLGQAFIDEAEHLKQINPNAYEHEYLGVSNGVSGAVFDNVVCREITDDEINTFEYCYNGIDWGWYPDPFAFVRCSYDPAKLTLYIFAEYRCNKKSNEDTASIVKEYLSADEPLTCGADEQKSISDYRAFGLQARSTDARAGTVNYSHKWLQRLKEIVIDPIRCPETYKEFSEYQYERDNEGNVITGYPDKNNHSIDAVRYAMCPVWRRKGY